jgi:hypothetical protein
VASGSSNVICSSRVATYIEKHEGGKVKPFQILSFTALCFLLIAPSNSKENVYQ